MEIGTEIHEEEGRADTASVSDVCNVIHGTEEEEEEEEDGEEDMTGRDEDAGIGEGDEGVS